MSVSPQYEKVRRILRERRAADPPSDDVTVLRRRLDSAALPPGEDIQVTQTSLGRIPVEELVPNAEEGRALLYAHGGGFVVGSPSTHRKLAGDFARAAAATCFNVDYRLAPEHVLPAPVEDLVAAYDHLLGRYRPEAILMAGDSAGGSLIILTLIHLRESGAELPAGAVIVTPWVDYHCQDRSYTDRADGDPITLVSELSSYHRWFLGEHDADDPTVSPLDADLTGLPPLLIHGGGGDVMCNDAARLAARARAYGVDVTHRQVPEMMHVWHVFAGRVPEATDAMGEVSNFAERRLVSGSSGMATSDSAKT